MTRPADEKLCGMFAVDIAGVATVTPVNLARSGSNLNPYCDRGKNLFVTGEVARRRDPGGADGAAVRYRCGFPVASDAPGGSSRGAGLSGRRMGRA